MQVWGRPLQCGVHCAVRWIETVYSIHGDGEVAGGFTGAMCG